MAYNTWNPLRLAERTVQTLKMRGHKTGQIVRIIRNTDVYELLPMKRWQSHDSSTMEADGTGHVVL